MNINMKNYQFVKLEGYMFIVFSLLTAIKKNDDVMSSVFGIIGILYVVNSYHMLYKENRQK